jgi:hypothetical protein
MRAVGAVLLAAVLAGCSGNEKAAPKTSKPALLPPKITQLYATKPSLPRGEQGLLCYGVENAKTVTLTPPRQELSAALSRCVEVKPAATITYTLTAEGEGGRKATQDVTVTVGAARVRIVEVRVSELQVLPGDPVSLCYKVANARAVRIEPIHFRAGEKNEDCVVVNPRQTTTFVVTATGASGDTDQEQVTIKVR